MVGFPHDIKGQGIYAYVTLMAGEQATEALRKELVAHVRKEIGPIATPDYLQWAPGLPKTRSRQDHAPHPAQDRRERARPARRHLHPGRSVGGRVAGAGTGGQGVMPCSMTTLLDRRRPPAVPRGAAGASRCALLPEAGIREADNADALYALVEAEPDADLLLLDLNMPGVHGFSALVHLRAVHPQLPVAIVSAREEPEVMRRALDHGAMGFIPKSSDAATLGTALRQVLDGERWIPPAALAAKPMAEEERAIAARIRELTPQQFRVLQMLGSGLLNKQIGYELGVSEATIKAHMSAILRKLGATNRTQAILLAGKLLVDPESVVLPEEPEAS